MTKYHITIECAGVSIRIKNVEATNQDDAEIIALNRARKSLKIVGSTIAVDETANARPISGEEIYNKFFGKR